MKRFAIGFIAFVIGVTIGCLIGRALEQKPATVAPPAQSHLTHWRMAKVQAAHHAIRHSLKHSSHARQSSGSFRVRVPPVGSLIQ